jgi:hypothetical protein
VGWNPETKQMMGWFYNVDERQTMPKLGGYLNLAECDYDYAQMSDILEMRKDYLDNHQECNTSVKSWEQMDEHERLDCKMLQHQARMRDMVVQGRLSIGKYQAWVRKLQNRGMAL